MGESRGSPRKIRARTRELEALAMREAGAKYTQIAEQLGYRAVSSAQRAVLRALSKLTPGPEADRLRELEVTRLDALQVQLWGMAEHGDMQAVDRVLKIMERRAKLLGLDAPVKQEMKVGVEAEKTVKFHYDFSEIPDSLCRMIALGPGEFSTMEEFEEAAKQAFWDWYKKASGWVTAEVWAEEEAGRIEREGGPEIPEGEGGWGLVGMMPIVVVDGPVEKKKRSEWLPERKG